MSLNLTTKVLELKDYDDLVGLMLSRSSFLAVPEQAIHTHKMVSMANARDLLSVGQGVGRIFGLYDDQQILQGVVFTAISQAQPCYFVNKAYTRPDSPGQTLPMLFEFLIKTYEGLGYRRFYTMYREQDIEVYHKLWRTSTVLKDYISYSDLEVKPNTRPKHSDFWELMFGRMLFETTMVIRGFVNKNANMYFNE